MGGFHGFTSFLLLAVFFVNPSPSISANVYVVYMGTADGHDPDQILALNHQMIASVHHGSYKHAFRGFAARLSEHQASDIANLKFSPFRLAFFFPHRLSLSIASFMGSSSNQASLLLQKQLMSFQPDWWMRRIFFEWTVTIIGPQDTGGFFNAIMSFPQNYPNSPPTVRFISEMWHPNVYPDGKVCISILHPPGDEPNGYELASERWNPVSTLLKA